MRYSQRPAANRIALARPPRVPSGVSDAQPVFEFVISYAVAVKAIVNRNYANGEKDHEKPQTRSRVYASSRDEALEKVKALFPPLPAPTYKWTYEWRITVEEANEVRP